MPRCLLLTAALLLMALAIVPRDVLAVEDCPHYEPVLLVEGADIYKPGSSGADKKGEEENSERLAPVINFMKYEAKAVDEPSDKSALKCSLATLTQWAEAGALLEPPDTPGRVARVWISSGMGFILAKYKALGVPLPVSLVRWYANLAATVRNDYHEPLKKAGYKGLFANTYPWAAVSSALSALIGQDAAAYQFQDEAWLNMLAEVQPDGSLIGEMTRGQRALIYHLKAADGLVILNNVREALGEKEKSQQIGALKRLLAFSGNGLCDPTPFAKRAGELQEKVGEYEFRGLLAFGRSVLPESFGKCGPQPKTYFWPEYTGGDARQAHKAVWAVVGKGSYP